MILDRTVPPIIRQFSDICIPVPKQLRLDNGIKMNIIDKGIQDVSRIDIIMNGGQCEESKCGVASLALKSFAKGTLQHSETEIAEIFDFYGAWINCSLSDHHSTISLFFTNRNFAKPLSTLKEIITDPSFPDKELDVSKKQAIEALKSQNEKTKFIAAKEFNKKLFGAKHPLGKELDENSIRELNRNDMISFYRKLISTPFQITLSGKVTKDIIDYVSNLFRKINFEFSEPVFYQKDIVSVTDGVTMINKPDAVQSTVLLGQRTPKRDSEIYIPLRILIELFGGFFGSRLNKNIRESKGLTYGISAGLLGRIDLSCIQIATDCDNKYVQQVIKEIDNEMHKIRKVKVEDSELNILKSYMLSEYIKMIDSPFSVASLVNNHIVYGFPENYLQRQIEITKNITAEELQNIANRYLIPENFFTIIVGNENMINICLKN